ncbi:MAG TPA: sigma-70 family RNA polymerase sigma factor [Planctomycetota bacterium]|nr:sigma-70 family RNA polymerase sigma factor [Planctomycetota bacterium]
MARVDEADELLVAEAQRGDVAAFGQLVERYQDALFNGVSRMVSQREDAEDLAQEAFVKAFRGIGAFEGRSSFYTWLYSIAFNVVVSHRRKVGSARHLRPLSLHEGSEDDGRGHQVEDNAERPGAAIERRELRERLELAIADLADDYREVIVMRDIEGFGYQAIAEVLGCPEGTVKSRLHRARQALREQLKDLLV